MRPDVFCDDVLKKCEALKRAGLWPAEPALRPSAWMVNFDDVDRVVAAVLLDHFTFYNNKLTSQLLRSAFSSLGDGLPKGPAAPESAEIERALRHAVFTGVEAENPRPTDSGYLFCRKARQLLDVPDGGFVENVKALSLAAMQVPVVFLDDFVGSGDQFLATWTRVNAETGSSFATVFAKAPFIAIYVTLVATEYGLERIARAAPHIAVSPAHVIHSRSSVHAIKSHPNVRGTDLATAIPAFLLKYAPQLAPKPDDAHISTSMTTLAYGHHGRGLLMAFEHTIPDSTLPIFWSPGKPSTWTPLRERK